ncbi:hypothetical protein QP178_07000 [Sphingomonas aurantiaca]|uniref:hypothetical protein n=1 Tax=Sphingomonas aurantiaca TaxID=185949 RepID=UPI000B12CD4E
MSRSTQPNDGLTGLRPVVTPPPFGVMPNAAHQDALGFMKADTFALAVVEFDDQGRCYDRAQLDKVSDRVETMRTGREDVILLLFVHGWKHDARSDDPNLSSFRVVLAQTAAYERSSAAAAGGAPRPVMGIFVGWRGLTAYGPSDIVADTTFWGRQAAGHRVAVGSVRELFGRLRHYRNSRLKNGGAPLLVIAGHSFGGMIVYSALAQSLIESASAPVETVIAAFADLVVLANPAIEGARYLPIYDLVSSPAFKGRTNVQLPVFVCVQATNDQPVGTFFPIGNFANRLEEATIGGLEERCVTHAIGFIDEFRTHKIAGPDGNAPFVLTPPQIEQADPFWVVAAAKAVIDGHSGIWQAPFLSFLKALVFQQVARSQATTIAAASLNDAIVARSEKEPGTGGNLADFAKEIGL